MKESISDTDKRLRKNQQSYLMRVKVRETKEIVFYDSVGVHMRKEISVKFDRINHLKESAIALQKKMEDKNMEGTRLYESLEKLINEAPERKAITNELKVYEHIYLKLK